ncbi:MAG: hypothetical protein IJ849_00840 [Selenomonadaceae bacterium]|nr:hypothetical protein [Selenomonadaceae bacterium]
MITEFMAGLILLGLFLILLARFRTGRKQAADERLVGESTANLKQELERTGSEIIGRMESQVSRLENLIYEAEEKNTELSGQMAEMGRLQQVIQQQLGEEKILSAQLSSQLHELATRQQQIAALHREQLSWQTATPQATGYAATASPVSQGYAQETLGLGDNMERVDAEDFAAVLKHSIAQGEQDEAMSSESAGMTRPTPSMVMEAPDASPEEEPLPSPVETEADRTRAINSIKARSLLISGWSVDDVAKETGLGKGAVELLKQMTAHQIK